MQRVTGGGMILGLQKDIWVFYYAWVDLSEIECFNANSEHSEALA